MALSPSEVSDRFSKEVKRRRLMLGMSCKELARAVGCYYTTVYGWEKGIMPNIRVLPRLAEALHVSGMELLYPSDNVEAPISKLDEKVVQEIKRLRLSRKITQEEFAEKVGVTWSTVARWETGEVEPDVKYLPKFAEILGVSEEDLLNPSSDTEAPKKYAKARGSGYKKNRTEKNHDIKCENVPNGLMANMGTLYKVSSGLYARRSLLSELRKGRECSRRSYYNTKRPQPDKREIYKLLSGNYQAEREKI